MNAGLERTLALAHAWWRTTQQDEEWTDAEGTVHQVRDMDPRYRRNVIRFLEKRAEAIAFFAGLGEAVEIDWIDEHLGIPTHARDAVDEGLDRHWAEQLADPVAWLHTTPLVKALEEGAYL